MPVLTADDMFEQATEKNKEALAILTNPDCTPEEEEKAERMMQHAKDLTRRSETVRQMEKERDAAIEKFQNKPVQTQATNETDNSKKSNEDGLDGFKSIGHWFKAVHQLHKRQVVDERLKYWGGSEHHTPVNITSMKALAENVGASGGFLVQPEFERRIRAVQANMAIMRPRATIVRMGGRTLTLNVLDQTGTTAGQFSWFGGIVTYWLEEAGTLSETQPAFKQTTLTAHNLTAYAISSAQLLDDSGQALEDFLMGNLGFPAAIAHTEDYAFLQGDGLGKPEGLINSGARYLVNRNTANTVTYDDLAAMLTHMLPNGNAIWVAHQSVLEKLLLMNGPSGNPVYLWGNAQAGVPNSLLGRPIIFTDKLPFVGTEGDICYIDPSFYLIGDRQQTTIDMSTEEHFRTNQVSWRAMCRVDGKAWLTSPITYQDGSFQISPFVVLSSVAT